MSARLAPGFFTEAFWLGFGRIGEVTFVRGRRFAAGAAVTLQFGDAGFVLDDFGLKAGLLFIEQSDDKVTHAIQAASLKGSFNHRSQSFLFVGQHISLYVHKMLKLS